MSAGLVVCSHCRREVHEDGERNPDRPGRRFWRHCEDKTDMCLVAMREYPTKENPPVGPVCGRDEESTLSTKREDDEPAAELWAVVDRDGIHREAYDRYDDAAHDVVLRDEVNVGLAPHRIVRYLLDAPELIHIAVIEGIIREAAETWTSTEADVAERILLLLQEACQ